MKCIDSGTIQALIDGELDISVKKDVEKHLADCEKCKDAYDGLKRNDDFAFGKLTAYREFCQEIPAAGGKDSAGMNNKEHKVPGTGTGVQARKKKAKGSMFKYRKIAAVACIAAFLTLCATVQPVKAFISDALSIFRVEGVKGFGISFADMEEIRQKLEQGEGEIDIDSVGSIQRQGFEGRTVSMKDIKNAADFPVLLPPEVEDGGIDIRITEPGQISFTMKVGNVNEALKSFGAQKLLPSNLDGKTFTAGFASEVNYTYNENGSLYHISQTRAPELTVPSDVNVEEVYDCLVDLPILPQEVQQRLKSIKDWKDTIYLPVINAEPQEVSINGAGGFIAGSEQGGWIVAWYNGGVIYRIDGNAGREDILRLAESMR